MAKLAKFVKVNCEWDIGQDGALFSTREEAHKWVEKALVGVGIEETIDELEDDGYVNYEHWEVIA